MSQKATTKDEIILLKLYEMAIALGDPYHEVDRYAIGKAVGQNDRGIDTITRDLAQANFIKKGEENAIYLTPHGMNLVQFLLKQK